jgi:hypothetical protein
LIVCVAASALLGLAAGRAIWKSKEVPSAELGRAERSVPTLPAETNMLAALAVTAKLREDLLAEVDARLRKVEDLQKSRCSHSEETSSETPELQASSASARLKADAVVDTAVAAGEWTRDARDQVKSLFGTMTFDDRKLIRQKVGEALNQGKLRTEFHGPPF